MDAACGGAAATLRVVLVAGGGSVVALLRLARRTSGVARVGAAGRMGVRPVLGAMAALLNLNVWRGPGQWSRSCWVREDTDGGMECAGMCAMLLLLLLLLTWVDTRLAPKPICP